MNKNNLKKTRLSRFADALLPGAMLTASLFGREAMAFGLFMAFYAVKLFSLATANGLRAAFARQPSMRYVQGSALLALALQLAGAAVAALILRLTRLDPACYALIACGTLLNIEHVFYEYLHAVGDGSSATLCRCITALLTLTGLLLCAQRSSIISFPTAFEPVFLMTTSGASALVGLIISLTLGGRFRPKPNAEVLKRAPMSLLKTFLFPVLCLTALVLLKPEPFTALPLFAGLTLYEPCRTPFRRTPSESRGMNRALLIVCAVAVICAVVRGLTASFSPTDPIMLVCGGIVLAAICAFLLFGSVKSRKETEY